MFITYEGEDGEVLVTTHEKEAAFLVEYFDNGGRKRDEYDRNSWPDVCAISVESRMRVDGQRLQLLLGASYNWIPTGMSLGAELPNSPTLPPLKQGSGTFGYSGP